MRIYQGRIEGHKLILHSMKDSKGHFTNGTCYFMDREGKKTKFKINSVVGTQDMIMIMELSTLQLLKLFFLSLFGNEQYKI